MNRHAWLLLSGCVWAVMMFLLFEREIRPYFEYQQPPTYRLLLSQKRQPEVQRRSVVFGAEKIGEAESLTEPLASGGYRLRSRILMKMQALATGVPLPDDRAYLASDVRVDAGFQLSEFRMTGQLQGIALGVSGDRQGDRLRVAYNLLGLFKGDKLVDFPRDATLSDNFLPFQGGVRLSEGKKWRMKFLDVTSLATLNKGDNLGILELYAAVVGREVVQSRGRETPTFKVEVRKEPTQEYTDYIFWVDEEGTVVRQQMRMSNKLVCEIVLEHQQRLTADEAAAHSWAVQPPK